MKKKIAYITLSFALIFNMFATGFFQTDIKALDKSSYYYADEYYYPDLPNSKKLIQFALNKMFLKYDIPNDSDYVISFAKSWTSSIPSTFVVRFQYLPSIDVNCSNYLPTSSYVKHIVMEYDLSNTSFYTLGETNLNYIVSSKVNDNGFYKYNFFGRFSLSGSYHYEGNSTIPEYLFNDDAIMNDYYPLSVIKEFAKTGNLPEINEKNNCIFTVRNSDPFINAMKKEAPDLPTSAYDDIKGFLKRTWISHDQFRQQLSDSLAQASSQSMATKILLSLPLAISDGIQNTINNAFGIYDVQAPEPTLTSNTVNKNYYTCYDVENKTYINTGSFNPTFINNDYNNYTIEYKTYVNDQGKNVDSKTDEEVKEPTEPPVDPEEPPVEDEWPSDTPSWIKVLADIIGGILKGIGEAISGLVKLLVDGLSSLFHTLFVPSENFVGDKFTSLQENFNQKMPVVNQITETSSNIQQAIFSNMQTNPPNVSITLPKEMMLGDVDIQIFDFSYFNQYRDMIHSIIIFMMYTPFVLDLSRRIKSALN